MEEREQQRPLSLALTVVGGLGRLLPHWPNFTPVGGMSLFAGARLPGWQAYLVPLVIMAVTDPLLHLLFGIPGYTKATPLIYASFLLNVLIGRLMLAKSENAARIGAAAFLCSVQFFVISNFAVWLGSAFYVHNTAGLLACYTAALPFFGRTLAGDLFFSAVLFGLHAWLSRRIAQTERTGLQTA